jgi:glycerol-3-phosphate cytidylyltransferase
VKKYKTGYTTGVFDLFHVGHLNILRQAKEHCEELIVGVSTDQLVLDYKGEYPVISHFDRMAIVEGIKYVDRVIPQTDLNKLLAWEHLNFDVMFHGDDWKGNALFVKQEFEFKRVGVEVIYFPYTKGVSSSIVKEKMKV